MFGVSAGRYRKPVALSARTVYYPMPRSNHSLIDDRKTYDEVFDRPTLMAIAKLINDAILETLDYPVSTGKEGNVFHGTGPRGAVAVKIYRVSNATFKHLGKYIVGDPRFKGVKRNTRGMVEAWAQKEYRNLRRMSGAGARVPRPIDQRNHVLVMEYIGDETRPAPLLRQVALDDPVAVFAEVGDYELPTAE